MRHIRTVCPAQKSLEMKIALLAKKSKEKRIKMRVSVKFSRKELSELCEHNFDIDLCQRMVLKRD